MAGDFSDEEWDISDDQWTALEHDAVVSTQQAQQQTKRNDPRSRTASGRSLRRSSTERLDSSSLRRAVTTARPQNGHGLVNDQQDSFENPQLDEDGIPLVVEEQPQAYLPPTHADETAQREQWRLNRYAQKHGPQPQLQAQPQPQPQTRPRVNPIPRQAYQEYQQRHQNAQYGRQAPQPVQPSKQQLVQQQSGEQPAPPTASNQTLTSIRSHANKDNLQAQLEQLKQDNERLAQNLNHVQTELYTAKGEITLIRSRSANEQKIAERHNEVLRKQMQEEANKHQAALQSKDAAYGQLVTDNNFLKHELDEQNRKVHNLQRSVKERPLQDRPNDVNLSPRKGITNSLRDGFDDDEVMHMSPGRSPSRRRASKPSTPTKKRKHPTSIDADMPTLALRLTGERPQSAQEKPNPEQRVVKVVQDHRTRQHLQLLQDVLAFRPCKGQETVVESLVGYAFPSDASRPLSSILIAESSKLKGDRLPGDLLHIFTRFLQRCLKEGYYKPLNTILDAICHILDLDPTVVDAEVINTIVSPLQQLANINSKIRFLYFDQRQKTWNQQIPKPVYKIDVNTAACLEVLITIAGLIFDDKPLLRLFWKVIEPDTILLLLAAFHPVPELELMLELMETSIFPNSFGVICIDKDQAQMEFYTIDKACYLLWEPPRHVLKTYQDKRAEQAQRKSKPKLGSKAKVTPAEPEDKPPTRLQLCHFHLKLLAFLSKIAITSTPHPHQSNIESHHGTNSMLHHPAAIPRLMRFLYDQVNKLYATHPDTHALHAQLVNRTTTLLHHLLLSPQAINKSSRFNLAKALTGVKAGVHHFRVALARITFREGTEPAGVDFGITDETVQKANEILEEYVEGPDEALQLLAAFGKDEEEDDEEAEDQMAEAEVMADVER